MNQILGIGNALVDIMTLLNDDQLLNEFLLPKGSMQLVDAEKSALIKSGTKDLNRSLSSGGSAANTIHGLAMLGVNTGFIGSIGKDELGVFFENDMKSAGIKTMLSSRNTVTGTAVAMISPDSERTFATHLGAAVELMAEDLKTDYFDGYDILYLEGYLIFNKQLVVSACKMAKDLNMKIALDLSSYNVVELKLADFHEIVNDYIDIVFANEEEAKAFTGKSPAEALNLISDMCEVAVVKTGSEGSIIKRGDNLIKVKAHEVNCKDTTGAGDLYAAGFLYGYLTGLDIEKCGRIGSLVAGKVVENIGAKISTDGWEKIRHSLKDILKK